MAAPQTNAGDPPASSDDWASCGRSISNSEESRRAGLYRLVRKGTGRAPGAGNLRCDEASRHGRTRARTGRQTGPGRRLLPAYRPALSRADDPEPCRGLDRPAEKAPASRASTIRGCGSPASPGRLSPRASRPIGVEGVEVRVYSAAKTVADCFKYRNKVGIDVAVEALRDFGRRHRGGASELARFARVCRVTRVMQPYLDAIGMTEKKLNLAASVTARLLNRARQTGADYQTLLDELLLRALPLPPRCFRGPGSLRAQGRDAPATVVGTTLPRDARSRPACAGGWLLRGDPRRPPDDLLHTGRARRRHLRGRSSSHRGDPRRGRVRRHASDAAARGAEPPA